jgi:hypothetical protein
LFPLPDKEAEYGETSGMATLKSVAVVLAVPDVFGVVPEMVVPDRSVVNMFVRPTDVARLAPSTM